MKNHSLIRIHSKGGLFTTQEIRSIVRVAVYYGIKHLYASTRQELLFYVRDDKMVPVLKKMKALDLPFFEDDGHNNIVSSLPSVNVFSTKKWLKSGVYLDIIDSFKINPKLKIGLIDPEQELTPLLQNQINFIASDDPGYWYVYLCLVPNKEPYLWPVKVDSVSIFQLAKQIESMFIGDKIDDGDELVRMINDDINYDHLAFNEKPVLPSHSMPSYDGIHNAGNGLYWLGITQQENKFSVSFLESLSYLCQEQKNNNIYITNWGSILIRNIAKKDTTDLNYLLAEHSINTGHAYSELNWVMADVDSEARELKRKIVAYFYKKNARTEGLTFGIDTGKEVIFPSVLIKEVPFIPLLGWKKYDISHAKDFDVKTKVYIPYRQRVTKSDLPQLLYRLCGDYFKFMSQKRKKIEGNVKVAEQKTEFSHGVYQCNDCMTVYDPQYGDAEAGVLPGTSFEDIPGTYTCSLCGAKKERFTEISSISQEVE